MDPGTFEDDDVEQLGAMNFHFFLGYATNFRRLRRDGITDYPATPANILELISNDNEMSQHIYGGIRTSEQNLRHLLAKYMCNYLEGGLGYLEADHYSAAADESVDFLIHGMVRDVLRYTEPYVEKHITQRKATLGLDLDEGEIPASLEDGKALVEDLPIWSVVDGLSFGKLVSLINRFGFAGDADANVWRPIAGEMEINSKAFLAGIASIKWLRNMTAHNSRLWMWQVDVPPKKPALYNAALRDVDVDSMLTAIYNLAVFQGTSAAARNFTDEVEEILRGRELYRYGLSKTRHKAGILRAPRPAFDF